MTTSQVPYMRVSRAGEILSGSQIFASGGPYELTLRPKSAKPEAFSIKNVNPVGGASIQINVPPAVELDGVENGSFSLSPQSAFSAVFDGVNFFSTSGVSSMTFQGPAVAAADNVRALTAAATINDGDLADFTVTSATTATLGVFSANGKRAKIRNMEASTAVVTIAVPSGATLDGVLNGTFPVPVGQEFDVEMVAAQTYVLV